jgi:hypothetical protein
MTLAATFALASAVCLAADAPKPAPAQPATTEGKPAAPEAKPAAPEAKPATTEAKKPATAATKSTTPAKPAGSQAKPAAGEPGKSAQPKPAAAAKKPKPVDINSASAEELKKVPGIGDAEAEKIVKNRPYPTRSHLVTRNVLSYDAYMAVKDRLVAANPPQPKPKK